MSASLASGLAAAPLAAGVATEASPDTATAVKVPPPSAAGPVASAAGCPAGPIGGGARASGGQTWLPPFEHSAFPYDGIIPRDKKPFLDVNDSRGRGHTSPRGNLHWEADAYNDRRSLLYIPKSFNISRPALLVVFFHGNHATLERDVVRRQRVPAQLAASGLNAVLVAPQFAVNVADSSAGWFWEAKFFNAYLAEAAQHLAQLYGDNCVQLAFERLPVVLVAYSGGYNAAAYALDVGGANRRIAGVILLDALYGETDKFDRWLDGRGSGFFFSAYSESSQAENHLLQQSLAARQLPATIASAQGSLRLQQGSITFLRAGSGIRHNDFVTEAWVADPLKVTLAAIEGFRAPPPTAVSAAPNRKVSPLVSERPAKPVKKNGTGSTHP